MSSLVSIAQTVGSCGGDLIGKKALYWVVNQIDFEKLAERASQYNFCPTMDTKCVLLEYNYTPWSDVKAGVRDVSDRLPGTDVLVHSAVSSESFNKFAIDYLIGHTNKDDVVIYIRRKILSNGEPDTHKRQLVMLFMAKQPPLPQSPVPLIDDDGDSLRE